MFEKHDRAYLNIRRRLSNSRDEYILACAIQGAQERLEATLKMYDLLPTDSLAMQIGVHRGLIFYLMELPTQE